MGKMGQARVFLFFRIVNKFFSASEKKQKGMRKTIQLGFSSLVACFDVHVNDAAITWREKLLLCQKRA